MSTQPPDVRSAAMLQVRANRFATALLVALLYLLYSRAPEYGVAGVLGVRFFVRIIPVVLLVAALFTEGLWQAVASRPLRYLTAFSAWLVVSTPFSVWKGGSVALLTGQWFKTYLFAAVTAAFIATAADARKALLAIAIGILQMAFIMPFISVGGTGRLQAESGTVGNPNDLAFFLLGGVPGCMLLSRSDRLVPRVLGNAGIVVLLLLALKTGSRMGLIMMFALLAVQFLRGSLAGKVKLVFAACLVACLGIAFAPASVIERYQTMWSSVDAASSSREGDRALGSSSSRKELLIKSLEVTLKHPLLGVGPGEFGDFVGGDPEARRTKVAYRQTHNTYTQISSEAGLPALGLYLALLVYVLRTSFSLGRRLRKIAAWKSLADTADALFLAAVMFAVGACFGSLAYGFFFPVIASIAGAFARAVTLETRTAVVSAPARQPSARLRSPHTLKDSRWPAWARLR